MRRRCCAHACSRAFDWRRMVALPRRKDELICPIGTGTCHLVVSGGSRRCFRASDDVSVRQNVRVKSERGNCLLITIVLLGFADAGMRAGPGTLLHLAGRLKLPTTSDDALHCILTVHLVKQLSYILSIHERGRSSRIASLHSDETIVLDRERR